MFDFFSNNWQMITGAIGAVITFFAGMKLRRANATERRADALSAMQGTYAVFTTQVNERILTMEKEIHQLQNKVAEVERENKRLKKHVSKLSRENQELKKENNHLKED